MMPKIDDAFRERVKRVAVIFHRSEIQQPSITVPDALESLTRYLTDVLELFALETELSVLAAQWELGFSISSPFGFFRHFILHFTIRSSGFHVCADQGNMRRVFVGDIVAACANTENPALTAWRVQVLLHAQLTAIIDQILQAEAQSQIQEVENQDAAVAAL